MDKGVISTLSLVDVLLFDLACLMAFLKYARSP